MLGSIAASRVFDPRRIAGLEAWWDASDSQSVTLDSGRVSQLSDKSGKGRHAANSTSGSTQPSYITGATNGLNVARFVTASTQVLTVASSTAAFKFLHDGTKSYIACVASFGTSADPNAAYGFLGTNGSASANIGTALWWEDRAAFSRNNGIATNVTLGSTGSFVITSIQNDVLSPQAAAVVEAIYDAANATAASRYGLRINGGSLLQNNAATNAPSSSNATYSLQLGSVGNGVLPMTGDICEILIYSQQPTDDAQARIRRYLGRKWGVSV